MGEKQAGESRVRGRKGRLKGVFLHDALSANCSAPRRDGCGCVSDLIEPRSPAVYKSVHFSCHRKPANYFFTKCSVGTCKLPTMCFQLNELYSACRCLYFQHPVDRCGAYGTPGHGITRKNIFVAYACSEHSTGGVATGRPDYAAPEITPGKVATVKRAISKHASRPARARVEPGTPKPTGESIPQYTTHEGVAHVTSSRTAPLTHAKTVKEKRALSTDTLGPLSEADSGKHRPTRGAVPSASTHQTLDYVPPSETLSGRILFSDVLQALGTMERIMKRPNVRPSPMSEEATCAEAVLPVFHRLVDFQCLRFLWPQVIRCCGSREKASQKIMGFLDCYAVEFKKVVISDETKASWMGEVHLGEMVWALTRQSASNLIRRERSYFAETIIEAYKSYLRPIAANHGKNKIANGEEGTARARNNPGAPKPVGVLLQVLEACLFETNSISTLQDNIAAFLRAPQASRKTVWDSFTIPVGNKISSLRRLPVRAGMKRITWTCVRLPPRLALPAATQKPTDAMLAMRTTALRRFR